MKFAEEVVTCTLDPKKLEKYFGIDAARAANICKAAKEVNTHHCTKTCRKYCEACRFLFPRRPSKFNIIAQCVPDDMTLVENTLLFGTIDWIFKQMEEPLKLVAKNIENRAKPESKMLSASELNEQFPIPTLDELLAEVYPSVSVVEEDNIKIIRIEKVDAAPRDFIYNDVMDKYPEKGKFLTKGFFSFRIFTSI